MYYSPMPPPYDSANNLPDDEPGERIEVDDDPYGYITPALDEDEEDDSGLSGDFEDEDEDDADDTIYQFALATSSAEKIANGEFEDGDIYHGCDGDDFDPYYEVETFRDRRLDQ